MNRIATAGYLPFDILLDPYHFAPNPSALVAPACQYGEPGLATDTAEEVHQMIPNPVTARVEDDDILLAELEGEDIAGDKDMSKEPYGVFFTLPSFMLILLSIRDNAGGVICYF